MYDEYHTNLLRDWYNCNGYDTEFYCSEEAGRKFNALGKQYVNGEVTAEYVKSVLLNTQIRPAMSYPYNYEVAAVSNAYIGECSSDKEFTEKVYSSIEDCKRRYGYIEVYKNDAKGQYHVYAIFAEGGN